MVVSEVVRLVMRLLRRVPREDAGREGGDAVVPGFGRGWRVVRMRVCRGLEGLFVWEMWYWGCLGIYGIR